MSTNNKQKTLLKKCADVARWAYNWALSKQLENFKNGGKFINDGELRNAYALIADHPYLSYNFKTEDYKHIVYGGNSIKKTWESAYNHT